MCIRDSNDLMSRKLWGVALAFWCLTTLIHLFTLGCLKGDTVSGYYTYCSQHKTGGGIIGGATAKFLCVSFGTAGAYVLMFIFLIISVIIITQHTVCLLYTSFRKRSGSRSSSKLWRNLCHNQRFYKDRNHSGRLRGRLSTIPLQ